ncbi:T9SS type A sorting domain-containing protein [Bacteroidales bacterium OttesenSCG-928-J19]|nr:T9SS type A sorting domain-containing protein [Bacteroidales bacterium OttesenSCG-928-J19]
MKKKLTLFLFGLLCLYSLQAQQKYTPNDWGCIYVNQAAATDGDGSSWATAAQDLAEVLRDVEVNGTNVYEIWVAKGTYYPKYTVGGTTYEYKTFNLLNNVTIYGGFAGTEEYSWDRTDIEGNRTILSGDLDKDDDYETIVYTNDVHAAYKGTDNNVYHVVTCGEGVTSRGGLSGVTIEGGNARDGADDPFFGSTGGGLYIMSKSGSSPLLSELVVRYNKSDNVGGGIYKGSTGSVAIHRVKMHNNIAEMGAGFHHDEGPFKLNHFDIYDNFVCIAEYATDFSGFYGPAGAGGATGGSNVMLSLLNGKITGNHGAKAGAGLFLGGGYIIANVTIADNKADFDHPLNGTDDSFCGGVAISIQASGSISNTIIYGNTDANDSENSNYFADGTLNGYQKIKYSLVGGSGGSGSWNASNYGVNEGNNIDTDPLFIGAGELGNPNPYPYQISVNSPAVNTGLTTYYDNLGGNANSDKDLAEEDRLKGEQIDMGAYEVDLCPVSGAIVTDNNGIVYVKDYSQAGAGSAPVDADGSSWEKAHSSLADVLLFAKNYPHCIQEIWVAEGTHYPKYDPSGKANPTDSREKTFSIVSGVNIYGGFPANASSANNNDKDNIEHRNWNDWETILSGNLGNAGDADNAYHVVKAQDLGTTTEFNGLIVTGGNANGEQNDNLPDSGGGFLITASNISCTKSLYVKNTIITNNKANAGAGVYIDKNANPVFVNTLIDNNTAEQGGGVYIEGNMVRSSAVSDCYPTFINVTIADNHAAYSGGGIYEEINRTHISNTIVWGNTANSSAGVYGTPTITFSNIQGITASDTNLSESPKFAGASSDKPYSLLEDSPAINTGSNDVYYESTGETADTYSFDERDLGSDYRIMGPIIDMGAYEFRDCPKNILTDENGIVYVKDYDHKDIANSSKGNGSSWDYAYPNLADVLNAARVYPHCIQEIWVAEGTHYPKYDLSGDENPSNSRDKTFSIVSGVDIYGGFPANASSANNNDKDDIEHRNWNKWETVLSGNLGKDPDDETKSDNAFHVITSDDLETTTEFNGFIVTGGHIEEVYGSNGGGFLITASKKSCDKSLYVKNTIITNNKAENGGGVYIDKYASPVFVNTLIVNNIALLGGGVFVEEYPVARSSAVSECDPTFINVTIADNHAEVTGGIYDLGSRIKLHNAIVWDNTAVEGFDGILGYPEISYSIIQDVTASGTILSEDPKFARASSDKPYSLLEDSPAINTGNNIHYYDIIGVDADTYPSDERDLGAEHRILNLIIDMGAYEIKIVCPDNIRVGETTIPVVQDENGIVYVKDYSQAGAGPKPVDADGSSWEKAHPNLADVLLYANTYPGCLQEIWVAEGTHYPKYDPLGNPTPSNNRDKTFRMPDGVHIYGGFPANASTTKNNDKDNIEHRNWNDWETILSGNLDYLADKNDENKDNNAYHVVVSVHLLALTELNGFVITGGNADESNSGELGLLEIYTPAGVAGLFRGDGGGIYDVSAYGSSSSTLYVKNAIIRNNSSVYIGGGVCVLWGAKPSFVNTLIHDNSSCRGGGVFLGNGNRAAVAVTNPTFTNVTIADNIATCQSQFGGGIYHESSSHPYLYNSIIWGNTSDGNPNGIDGFGSYTTSNSIIQGVTGMDSNPLFVDSDNSDYSLSEESPAINTGDNDYYYNVIGVDADTYSPDERDLGADYRIMGSIIDMGAYEYRLCPPILVWAGGKSGKEQDWHTPANWIPNAVPQSCTDVYIPGDVTNFPMLTGDKGNGSNLNTCRNIYFAPGAQLGRPDLLNYVEAHVQIDYNGAGEKTTPTKDDAITGKSTLAERDAVSTTQRLEFGAKRSGASLDREKWHFFAAPLKSIYTGDYQFGGFPMTFNQEFDVTLSESETETFAIGNWKEFTSDARIAIATGVGFGHYVYGESGDLWSQDTKARWQAIAKGAGSEVNTSARDPKHIDGTTAAFGLGTNNGIIQFPMYEDEVLAKARRNHEYNSTTKKSAFHVFWQYPPSNPAFYNFTGEKHEVERAKAYRFIPENSEDVFPTTFTFKAGNNSSTNKFVLIGNPLMSALDYSEFADANSGLIKPGGHYIEGTSAWELSGSDIAPMQSFLVELNDGVSDLTFQFNMASMSITDNEVVLRSSSNEEETNRLTLTASNSAGSDKAYIARNTSASDAFCNNDRTKIIVPEDDNLLPLVYTIATKANGEQVGTIINTFSSAQFIAPIGLYTQSEGEICLNLSGMNQYDAYITFIDMASNTPETDITDKESFEYRFNHTPSKNAKDETIALENRFMIRFAPKGLVGIDELPTDKGVNAYIKDGELVVVSSTSTIKGITLYDLQGSVMLKETPADTFLYKTGNLPVTNGIYIVEVNTSYGVEKIKVIL